MVSVNSYLVVTPDGYMLCNDIKHIINSIKPYCYRLNANQLKSFNSCIRTHIKNNNFREPIKKGGTRNKFIISKDIYVIVFLVKIKLKNKKIVVGRLLCSKAT